MSGTDEQPVPVPSAVEPVAPAAPAAPVAVKPRRGLGAASFILGLLAILGDLIAMVLAVVAFAGAITNIGGVLNDPTRSLGSAIGVVIVAAIAVFGGLLFALLAVILGLVAAIRNRGRVLGVFGIIFGLLILIGHISAIVGIATIPSNGLTN
jgi:hypothetical protein